MFTPESNRPVKPSPFFDLWSRLTYTLVAFSEQGHKKPHIYAKARLGELSVNRFEHITTVSDQNNHWELDAETHTLQHIAFPNGSNKVELPQIVVEQFSFRHLKVAIDTAVQAECAERGRQATSSNAALTGVHSAQTPIEASSTLMKGTDAWLGLPTAITTNLQNVA